MSNQTNLKKITQEDLFNFLTCSPFPVRGKRSLDDLEIKITPREFFEFIYVTPIYSENHHNYANLDEGYEIPDYYDTGQPFSERRDVVTYNVEQLRRFKENLKGTAHDLLIINGTAGSGKSTEIQKMIHSCDANHKYTRYNLEEIKYETTIAGKRYKIPMNSIGKPIYVLWINLLQHLYVDILRNVSENNLYSNVYENFKEFFDDETNFNNPTTPLEVHFFECIRDAGLQPENFNKLMQNAIDALNNPYPHTNNDDDKNISVEEKIRNILRVTYWLLFCIDKKAMNFIVFDNIEQYIMIENDIVPLYDEIVEKMFEIIHSNSINVENVFQLIGKCKFSEHFKTIWVSRKTSMVSSAHDKYVKDGYSVDISSWFSFTDLFNNRKNYIEPLLEKKYDESLEKAIKVLEILTNDNRSKNDDNNLVQMLSSMYSGNVRRMAAALSEITIDIVEKLDGSEKDCICLNQFESLWTSDKVLNKYLMRRTILQNQLQRIVRKDNFKDLRLGYPDSEDKSKLRITKDTVGYTMRRVLVALWQDFDVSNPYTHSFVTFKDLVSRVFTQEIMGYDMPIDFPEFEELAEILYALNNPSFSANLSTPWAVIRFNEKPVNEKNDIVAALAVSLQSAWNEAKEEAKNKDTAKNTDETIHDDEDDDEINYAVRLTRAGYMFLSTLHADFSFFAALYCNNETPLMLLRNTSLAASQVETVCDKALGSSSENDGYINALIAGDRNFYGSGRFLNLRVQSKKQLYERKERKQVTLQELIIFRHHHFLKHYLNFLNNNHIVEFDTDLDSLKATVKKCIGRYEARFKTLKESNPKHIISTERLFTIE